MLAFRWTTMDVGLNAVCLILGLLQATTISALQWTNPVEMADGITFATCDGQDVNLPWKYAVPTDEHVMDTEWRFSAKDQTEQFLGTQLTQVSNHFLKDPGVDQNIEFLPNAGIRLLNVKPEYSGTYSVLVNLNHHGAVESYNQTASLVVTAASVMTGSQLHAGVLRTAVFHNNTQQYHVMLTCGSFESLWLQSVNVIWTTPDNKTLQSTSREQGQFLLAVPNPVVEGDYTCKIDNSSPAWPCLHNISLPAREATVAVDGCEARLTIIEGQMQAMERQTLQLQMDKARLNQQVNTLQTNKTELEGQLQTTTAKLDALETKVGVRLVNGSTFNEGRVEVWNGTVWGTVCDDDWHWPDAKVACEQLGLPSDTVIPRGYVHFGEGTDSIFMDDVNCTGTENSLLDCPFGGFGVSNCKHGEDAGLTCGGPPWQFRLVNGSNAQEGRLEVRVNGEWGTVCQDGWDSRDARVLCRQLGLPSHRASLQLHAPFGEGTGQVFYVSPECYGTENTLFDCLLNNGIYHCTSHQADVGVICICKNHC